MFKFLKFDFFLDFVPFLDIPILDLPVVYTYDFESPKFKFVESAVLTFLILLSTFESFLPYPKSTNLLSGSTDLKSSLSFLSFLN